MDRMSHPLRGGAVDFGGEHHPRFKHPGGDFPTPELPPGPGGSFGFLGGGGVFRDRGGALFFEISKLHPGPGGSFQKPSRAEGAKKISAFCVLLEGKRSFWGAEGARPKICSPPLRGGVLVGLGAPRDRALF